MSDQMLELVEHGIHVYDLGRPLFIGMPQSPNHPQFWHTLPRRHGDRVRPDGGSAANDLIVMGTHVGTHIDSLAHVSHQGKLFGGVDAQAACVGGGFPHLGVHTIAPIIRRGVLLDVPAALGWDQCPAAYEVTVSDLQAAMGREKIELHRGDVVLIRTGWGAKFEEGSEAYLGKATGVPGLGEAAATWLARQKPLAAGADTIAFEHLAAGSGHSVLPVHRILLVESGIYIIEALALEELANAGAYVFTFILIPLKIVGATGSPVRPLAVIPNA